MDMVMYGSLMGPKFYFGCHPPRLAYRNALHLLSALPILRTVSSRRRRPPEESNARQLAGASGLPEIIDQHSVGLLDLGRSEKSQTIRYALFIGPLLYLLYDYAQFEL